MRAFEFITETATSGGTSAGNIATVVKPLRKNKKGQSFFGCDTDDMPETATSGGTTAGDIATLIKPLRKNKKGQTLFAGDTDDIPEYGETTDAVILRRPNILRRK